MEKLLKAIRPLTNWKSCFCSRWTLHRYMLFILVFNTQLGNFWDMLFVRGVVYTSFPGLLSRVAPPVIAIAYWWYSLVLKERQCALRRCCSAMEILMQALAMNRVSLGYFGGT